ncbi:MAG: efflux RND transporter periplasmic adaptor subunit [Thermodesulfobacteriota bacterium]
MRTAVKFFVVLLCLALAGGLWYRWRLGENGAGPAWRTAAVSRGDLVVTIDATGTVEPEEVVDVGAQVAGKVLEFGRDAAGNSIDYGSVVTKGMVLARIDDAVYLTDVAQAAGQLQAAGADIQRAEADLLQAKSRLLQAEQDWQRATRLGPSEALSQASYDAYRAAWETARAGIAVGEAAILQARAGKAQAEAAHQRAERNLGYCTITSPVDGVIIDRRVNIGQTVVASLNAPSLFLIAKDLTRIQVWVAVNEADIGRIRPGLPVSFTVDAFPGETFRGEVGKIRLNASMTQNIVTYTVEITTDNGSGRLLPYLTANVAFELDRRSDVLLVPNAALRWKPPESARRDSGAEGEAHDGTAGTEPESGREGRGREGTERGIVWTNAGGKLSPVEVRKGPSDGLMTVVEGAGVHEGLVVIVGQETAAQADGSGGGNPFTPQFRRRGNEGGGQR